MYRTTPIHCSIGDLISDSHKLTPALKLQEMVKQGGGDNLVGLVDGVTPELKLCITRLAVILL